MLAFTRWSITDESALRPPVLRYPSSGSLGASGPTDSASGLSLDLLHRQARPLAMRDIARGGRCVPLVERHTDMGITGQIVDSTSDFKVQEVGRVSMLACTIQNVSSSVWWYQSLASPGHHHTFVPPTAADVAPAPLLVRPSIFSLTFLSSFSTSISRVLSLSSSLTASILAISSRSPSA